MYLSSLLHKIQTLKTSGHLFFSFFGGGVVSRDNFSPKIVSNLPYGLHCKTITTQKDRQPVTFM